VSERKYLNDIRTLLKKNTLRFKIVARFDQTGKKEFPRIGKILCA